MSGLANNVDKRQHILDYNRYITNIDFEENKKDWFCALISAIKNRFRGNSLLNLAKGVIKKDKILWHKLFAVIIAVSCTNTIIKNLFMRAKTTT